MKQVIAFIYSIFFFIQFLIAQGEDYKRFSYYVTYEESSTHSLVIAPSGLKLRQTPDKNGKVIVVLPLGTKVKIEEKLNEIPENRQIIIDENTKSYWLLVSNGKQKGYCCAGYLGQKILKMTKDYYFSDSYSIGCGDSEVLVNPVYYTYGFYEENRKQEIVEIKMEFINTFGEMGIRILSELKDKSNLKYIIYTKYQMKTGVLKGKNYTPENEENPSSNQLFSLNYEDESKNIYNNIELEKGKFTIGVKKILNKNTKTNENQTLYRVTITEKATGKTYQLGEYEKENITLDWAGDFDGDGKLDLILTVGGNHSSSTIFFLSRNAPNGKFLIEANRIDYYDCC